MNILFHLIRGTLSRFRSIVFAARKKQKKSIRKDECAILLSLLLFLLVNKEKTSQGGKIYAVARDPFDFVTRRRLVEHI